MGHRNLQVLNFILYYYTTVLHGMFSCEVEADLESHITVSHHLQVLGQLGSSS